MTTPSKINKALAKAGIFGKIVRNPSGYYYFIDELFDLVPSIYAFNLHGHTTEQVVKHVQDALANPKEYGIDN